MGLLSGIIKGVESAVKAVSAMRDLPGKINRWDLSRDIRKSSSVSSAKSSISRNPFKNIFKDKRYEWADDILKGRKGKIIFDPPKPPEPPEPPVDPPMPPKPPKPELSDQFLAICSVAGLDFDLLDDFVAKHQELCSRLGSKTSFTDDEYREIMFAVQIYMEQMTMMDRYIDWGSIDGTYIDEWGNIVSESDNSIIKAAGSF